MNLGTYLDTAVQRYTDHPYLQFYDQTVTYAEFGRQVNILANALKRQGFEKGDFIHVLVQNSPQTLVAYFAIQKIGAVAGPVNGWWKAPEVQYLLNDSKGRGLIVEDQYLPILDEIKANCPHLEKVIEVGDNPRSEHIDFAALLAEGDESPVTCDGDADDTAYIFYTSGTTGNPKGVLLSHKNVLADVDGVTRALSLEENMTALIFLPLFHVNAMLSCTFALGIGLQIVLRRQFSASEFWEVVDRYKVNFWSAVPAVYQILLSDPTRQKYDLSSLQFGICGAAPLTEETMKNFQKTFGIPIVEGYGLTEATCVSTLNPRDGERKTGSIGLPLPGQNIKILDENGSECPRGNAGEICIGGDAVMKGYFNRPEETADTIVDGYLHTGDVGVMDDDGYIFIVDRIKDMIIRGGENIYPKEIDNLLATHPMIQEAATVGVPDDTMGEEVKVFIISLDDDLTEAEVIEFCEKNLARFKVPKYVEIIEDDFPRSPIGKVLKKELREWGLTPRPTKDKGPQVTVADIFGTMESRVNPDGVAGVTANYGYIITGSGGGEWTVCVADGKVAVKAGLHDPQVTTTCSAKDWIAITLGKLDGMTAFSSGKLKVEGEMGLLVKAAQFFKKYQPPAPAPQVTVADIFGTMESRVNPDGVAGVTANYGYIITGSGGGEWTVCVADGKVAVKAGLHDPQVTTTCSAKDWIAITLGKLDGMTAFSSGKLKVEGEMGLLVKAAQFFKKYTPPGPAGQEEKKEELLRLNQVLSIPQRFATGPVMGKFLRAFKKKKILANKCPSCGRLQLPPREVCAECKVRAEEWVEVGPGGVIATPDITYYASPDPLTGESRETPYISAHFLLDGCKGHETLWHELVTDDFSKVKRGVRVRPVWNEKRIGAITDIKYFEIVE
ncbi:long-chain-fatty-acid--CoA ligase [uncultured Desulfosarcina sp.]|uniref:long-chain-fatty-acid--CoA ligase n=1 Tax=uncultured Desulfosarcina sp. TaxID=218289 RepID=UPI0029C8511B|nr:long-chain-fatty-acid--CoA ligase [uncultured Desulfosarcina sp.]